ncbi:MAG: hypothetical protein HZB98_07745 [Bacteroidia bacterium]|nr:hypothetical protein [Bacteroidia bacterium]
MKSKTKFHCPAIRRSARHFFICIIFLICGLNTTSFAQDLLKLKSGKEIKVSIVEETNDVIKYREYENQSGPVYTITRDKIESISYKKGARENQSAKPKEQVVIQETPSLTNSNPQLTVKKRFVYLDGVKQSSRSVKTIMEDNPEAISLYEKGKIMCDLSTSCAFGVILTSYISTSIANKQEDDADRMRISAIGLSIDGAFIITAIILSSSGKKNIRKSVSLYNSSAGKPVTYNMDIGIQENGIGVGLRF